MEGVRQQQLLCFKRDLSYSRWGRVGTNIGKVSKHHHKCHFRSDTDYDNHAEMNVVHFLTHLLQDLGERTWVLLDRQRPIRRAPSHASSLCVHP